MREHLMSLSTVQAIELGALSFLATNVDNLVVFATQMSLAQPHRRKQVALGQLLASVGVVGFCLALNHVLVEIPLWSFGILAIVPFVLCVKSAMSLRKPVAEPAVVNSMVGAAFVTFAISADNAASYLPLLRATSGLTEWLLVATFCSLFALLIGAAALSARTPATQRVIRSIGRFLEPPLYGILGICVLFATGII